MKYDFSGYATKNGLKCADGRTILRDAFKDNDGQTVPLVWQHFHNEPTNILGHALLENREDGVYAYGVFNNTEAGKNARDLVVHKDINALSIFANNLKQKGQDVIHGAIREVSLVLSGANPGAFIDFVSLEHSDGTSTVSEEEAVIYTGLELLHEAGETKSDAEDDDDTQEMSAKDIFDTLNEAQKTVVYDMIGHALEMGKGEAGKTGEDDEEATHSEDSDDNKGENSMKKNVFDKTEDSDVKGKATLTHDQLKAIIEDAQRTGSLKESFLAHTVTYGIENIDYLFPDAKTIADSPDLVARRMEWVSSVVDGAKHSPFSRIKTMSADLTLEDARAKGYVKGALKKEEFFALSRRTTTPTTIYKKQKLDRDDIIDITELEVVAWLKAEMRMMLDEEIGRAVLIGDGREVDDENKISETNIRPIATDAEFYAYPIQVATNTSAGSLIEEIIRSRTYYRGSGSPVLFTTEATLTDMLLIKDKMGRRIYTTEAELASALRVSRIIPVEVMEDYSADNGDLLGIMVNMKDYTMGADKGGSISMFDDFDIDYNQYKYLIETRLSGCLTKPRCAIVFWRASGTEATPEDPSFVAETNTITIPTVTGVEYLIDGKVVTGDVVIEEDTVVEADPTEGYYFGVGATASWDFEYTEE